MSTEKILIVEDEGIAALSLERKIQALGYQSAGIAFSGGEALTTVENEKPDLILMDIQLRGAPDGIETAKRIHEKWDIPIVYVTAFSDDETIERAKKTAPFGYLMKPYRDHSIKTTVEIALNAFRLERKQKKSENDFRILFELSPVASVLVNAEDSLVKVNTAFRRLFGLKEDKPVGNAFQDYFLDSDRETVALRNETLLASKGEVDSAEFEMVRHNGVRLWARIDSRVVNEYETDGGRVLHIISDVSAQNEMERGLLESNQKLRDFTSIASHDLRSPARITGAYISLLAKEYGGKLDERGREFLNFALSESKKMQVLVEDLLEYTKVSHSPSALKPISLNKVVRDMLAILSPEIEEKRADVAYEPLPTVYGNEVQLRRLFSNLIGNALKFNRSKPRVWISAAERADALVVSVSDNGVGIPRGDREKIFEMFKRGHSQAEFPGTGIGLASCKKIMENHKGGISVDSALAKGSTFHLTFPKDLQDKVADSFPNQEFDRAKNPMPLH